MAENKFNFLLMGKTGQGKSATGNMLLNRNVFKYSSKVRSQTKEVDFSLLRNKLIAELKAPVLTLAFQESISLLTGEIEAYSKQPSDIHKEQLQNRIQNLKEEIVRQDKGYNFLTDLLKTVKEVEKNLGDVVELQRLAAELESKRKAKTRWAVLGPLCGFVGGALAFVAALVVGLAVAAVANYYHTNLSDQA